MNLRLVATCLVRMRRLVIAGMIAELKDDLDLHHRLMAEFVSISEGLPLSVVMHNGVERRVIDPAARKVEREGILAQDKESRWTLE